MDTRRSSRHTPRRRKGFTIIELMLVVAVAGVLALVAYPSFMDSVRKGRRADAQAFLSEVAARQQHFLLDRRAYASSLSGSAADNGLAMTVPASVTAFYTVTLETDNEARPPAFVVSGAPRGSQSDDVCGTLRMDQRGAKSASGAGKCW